MRGNAVSAVIEAEKPAAAKAASAEVLARSLERTRNRALRDGAVGPGEFAAVRSALRDPSFSFVDALSVAASGRL